MIINAHTKIGSILKANPAALEAIISIHPKFEKLRNPILRKLLAGRTSIAMASKMGGCSEDDFFSKLSPLGFEIDRYVLQAEAKKKQFPSFLQPILPGTLTELDVRPLIESGTDPLQVIIERTKQLKPGHILKIINGFEPTPLILLLEKQGFESYADTISINLVETYFYKKPGNVPGVPKPAETSEDWDTILQRFSGHLTIIDVTQLEMPLPMMNILEAIDSLSPGSALFVHHKRIPVFLLPELVSGKFSYRIKEISDGDVKLLIFKE